MLLYDTVAKIRPLYSMTKNEGIARLIHNSIFRKSSNKSPIMQIALCDLHNRQTRIFDDE